MILNNLKTWRKANLYGFVGTFSDDIKLTNFGGMKNTSGTAVTTLYGGDRADDNNLLNSASATSLSALTDPTSTSYAYPIALGIGTSEVTEDDYALEFIYSNIQSVGYSVVNSYNVQDDKVVRTVVVTNTFKNNGTEAITITEYGIIRRAWYATSSSYPVLLTRDLLETPLTAQAGESFTISIEFKIETAV